MTVCLFLVTDTTKQCVGIMSLSAAEECIARGTGRLAAADAMTGRVLAATLSSDLGKAL